MMHLQCLVGSGVERLDRQPCSGTCTVRYNGQLYLIETCGAYIVTPVKAYNEQAYLITIKLVTTAEQYLQLLATATRVLQVQLNNAKQVHLLIYHT